MIKIQPKVASNWEMFWTVLATFAMGALFGWALLDEVHTADSKANWLAAYGTWVVGIGAYFYARESHVHRLAEVNAARLREQALMKRQLFMLIIKTRKLRGVKSALETLKTMDPEFQNVLSMRYMVTAARTTVGRVQFSYEDQAGMTEAMAVPLGSLEIYMESFDRVSADFLDYSTSVEPASMDADVERKYDELIANSAELFKRASALEDMLEARRKNDTHP